MKVNMALERYEPHFSEAEHPVLGNLLVAESLADVTNYAKQVKVSGWRAKILPFEEFIKGPSRVNCFVLVSGISHDPAKNPNRNGYIMISTGAEILPVDRYWNQEVGKLRLKETCIPGDLQDQIWENRDGLLFVTCSKDPEVEDRLRLVKVSKYPSVESLSQRIVSLIVSLEREPLFETS